MQFNEDFDPDKTTLEIRVDVNGNIDVQPKAPGTVRREGEGGEPPVEGVFRKSNCIWLVHYQENPCFARVYWTTSSGKRKWKDVEVECP